MNELRVTSREYSYAKQSTRLLCQPMCAAYHAEETTWLTIQLGNAENITFGDNGGSDISQFP